MLRQTPQGVPYLRIEDLYQVADPFDLLVFHGSDLISKTVEYGEELGCGSNVISHVGLYMTSEMFPQQREVLQGSPELILESTANVQIDIINYTQGIPDLLTGKNKIGVQLRNVIEVINNYLDVDNNNFVALGKLQHNYYRDPSRQAHINDYAQEFLNTYQNRYYEINPLNLAAAAFSWLRPWRNWFNGAPPKTYKLPIYGFREKSDPNLIKEVVANLESPTDSEMLFCSELASMAHKMIKTLPQTINPCDVAPVDYLNKLDVLQDLIYIINETEEAKFIEKFS